MDILWASGDNKPDLWWSLKQCQMGPSLAACTHMPHIRLTSWFCLLVLIHRPSGPKNQPFHHVDFHHGQLSKAANLISYFSLFAYSRTTYSSGIKSNDLGYLKIGVHHYCWFKWACYSVRAAFSKFEWIVKYKSVHWGMFCKFRTTPPTFPPLSSRR